MASVLFGVTNFGLSIGMAAAISSAVAAQQAFIAGCVAIAKGDLGAAFKYFSELGSDLGNVPITGDAKEIAKSFSDLVSQSGVKALAQVVAEAGTGDITALVSKAALLGGVALPVGSKEIFETRALIPEQLRPWYDRAVKEGGAALARSVPWYAQGTHMLGVVMGTLQNPNSAGIHAPRGHGGVGVAVQKPLDQMTVAELQATLANANANYARIAQTIYAKTHPAFLAAYEAEIAKIKVALDVKLHPYVLAGQGGGGGTMSLTQALAASKKSATSPGSPAPASALAEPVAPVVAGGILALLFFL
jgi:hypothetical protein